MNMRIIAIQCNKPFFQLNRIICNNPQAIFTFSDREEEMKNEKKNEKCICSKSVDYKLC